VHLQSSKAVNSALEWRETYLDEVQKCSSRRNDFQQTYQHPTIRAQNVKDKSFNNKLYLTNVALYYYLGFRHEQRKRG
jgi:hypothetical protein